MKNIQVTFDEPLLERVDEAAREMNLARSEFLRTAAARWLNELREKELDRRHREAYERFPLTEEELADQAAFEKAQDWGDPWEPGLDETG